MMDSKLVVSIYLNRVLTPSLRRLGITPLGNKRILKSIHDQMISLLHHWNDLEFRNAILLPVMEEAEFYTPASKPETRQFVVATVRNSLLELAASDNFRQAGLPKKLTDRNIVQITGNAIVFFEDMDFKALGDLYGSVEVDDIYGEVASRYPVAFQALKQLGNSPQKTITYDKCDEKTIDTEKLNMHYQLGSAAPISLAEDEVIDAGLIHGIGEVLAGNMDFFYADSFKMISRSFPKVMYVLEALLENNKPVVTGNYYISNGYLEQRKHLLKAAHTGKQAVDKIKELKSLGEKHREALLSMADNIEMI